MRRRIAIGAVIGAVLASGAGVAVAGVSDGNYRPERQHCSGTAEDHETADVAEEGCQNFTVSVRDGNDHEVASWGLPQLADGEHPDPTSGELATNPEGFDPSTGVRFYTGADDNLNGGEHDGSQQLADGPSDGGAIVLNVEPGSVQAWFDAVAAQDTAYLLTHPLPLVDAGIGACTDGVCWSTQTQQRTAYDGGNPDGPNRDVYNYEGHTWDPEECSSASDEESGPEACQNSGGVGEWHDSYGDAYVEPGVQLYEDPSPAGSPLGPYPIPSAYAGTCGVAAGGGDVQAPASPMTNSAGQVVVSTGC